MNSYAVSGSKLSVFTMASVANVLFVLRTELMNWSVISKSTKLSKDFNVVQPHTLDLVEIHSHSIQSIYRAELTFGNFSAKGF